ncbi:hypothetical protein AS593_18640 [Caulobacter vibrioides]|nr:hypothetical protein AS593_18640 [Caulobacter vibrioides]
MSLSAHARVLVQAWGEESRRRRAGGARQRVEPGFLPAALEVVETPPSPIGRAISWVIMSAAVGALAWSCWAKVDTVAIAEGRLVPTGRLRSVEPSDPGVVRAIAVREGERVRAGQLLIALDPTVAEADAESAVTELSTAGLTLARANALLSYAAGRGSAVVAPADADANAVEAERQLVAARVQAYEAKRASLGERRAGAEASARQAQAEIVKLQRTLPILQRQLDDQKGLEAKGYGARQKLLQQEQALVAAEQDLIAQQGRLDEARAQVASLGRDVAELREQFVGQAAQERVEAEGLSATRADALRKAEQKRQLQTLTAPVGGVVQAVSVTTLGEVAETGKALVTIVPDGEALVVEALVLNKDAGFVRTGDHAVIKLEAYPFTRYGTLEGEVVQISPDAIVDEKRGLVFPVRVKVSKSQLSVDGRQALLSAGMSASVEIVTGKRRVIDFIWSPVAKTVSEAGRER